MLKTSPKISVIMAVYNTQEEYLREAIESILNQTYTDFEFIIINDNSTNNAEKIILSYNDERIKYVKNETNLNAAGARNKGFNIAKGEYIAIMDSDDISLPQRFEKQIHLMENNSDIVVSGCAFERFNSSRIIDKITHKKNYEELKVQCLFECILANPSVILRKNFIDKHHFRYDEKFAPCEDYNLWSRIIKIGDISNLEEVLLKYRVHDNQISTIQFNKLLKNDLITKSELLMHYFTEIDKDDAILFARATQEKLNFIKLIKFNSLAKRIFLLNKDKKVLNSKIFASYLSSLFEKKQRKRFRIIKLFLGKNNTYKYLKTIY